MTVWVVLYTDADPYRDGITSVDQIFDTEKKAKNYVVERQKKCYSVFSGSYEYEKWSVN